MSNVAAAIENGGFAEYCTLRVGNTSTLTLTSNPEHLEVKRSNKRLYLVGDIQQEDSWVCSFSTHVELAKTFWSALMLAASASTGTTIDSFQLQRPHPMIVDDRLEDTVIQISLGTTLVTTRITQYEILVVISLSQQPRLFEALIEAVNAEVENALVLGLGVKTLTGLGAYNSKWTFARATTSLLATGLPQVEIGTDAASCSLGGWKPKALIAPGVSHGWGTSALTILIQVPDLEKWNLLAGRG